LTRLLSRVTVISNWVTANPSLEKKSSKLIVYSNVLAVKHGCITSKAMRQYSIDHPNIRMKEVLTNDSTRVDANHEGPFGIKTKLYVVSLHNVVLYIHLISFVFSTCQF
jgi:hypothetical protein